MAGQALNHVYGCEIDSESPDVTGIRKEEGALVLTLEHTGEGLELRGSSGEVEGMELMVNGRTMEDFCATVEKVRLGSPATGYRRKIESVFVSMERLDGDKRIQQYGTPLASV